MLRTPLPPSDELAEERLVRTLDLIAGRLTVVAVLLAAAIGPLIALAIALIT